MDIITLKDISKPQDISELKTFVFAEVYGRVNVKPENESKEYLSWTFDAVMQSGRDYLYGGDFPMASMLKKRTALPVWQKAVYYFLNNNPGMNVYVYLGGYKRKRMDYRFTMFLDGHIRISLPHHDAGGEKDWITNDGKYKYLVNVD